MPSIGRLTVFLKVRRMKSSISPLTIFSLNRVWLFSLVFPAALVGDGSRLKDLFAWTVGLSRPVVPLSIVSLRFSIVVLPVRISFPENLLMSSLLGFSIPETTEPAFPDLKGSR